jgi:hypothetical protein
MEKKCNRGGPLFGDFWSFFMVIFAHFWSFLLVPGVGVFWVYLVVFVSDGDEGLRTRQGLDFGRFWVGFFG